jgi:hypothetical protein
VGGKKKYRLGHQRGRFDFRCRQVQKKKAAMCGFFRWNREMLFARTFVYCFHEFRSDLNFDILLGLFVEKLGLGPSASVVGYGGFLRQLFDLGQHYTHGFLSYGEMSAFRTFGRWYILEAKQVVTAFHLI